MSVLNKTAAVIVTFNRSGKLPQDQAAEIVCWLTSACTRVEHPQDRDVEMFGPNNRTRLADRFSSIATILDHMTGDAPFYPDLHDMTRLRPINDVSAAEAALPELVTDARRQSLAAPLLGWLSSADLHRRTA